MGRKQQETKKASKKEPSKDAPKVRRVRTKKHKHARDNQILRAIDKFSAGVEKERRERQKRIKDQEVLVNRNPSAVLDREGMDRLRTQLAVTAPVRPLKSLLS